MAGELTFHPQEYTDFANYIEGDPDGIFVNVVGVGYNKGPVGGPDGLLHGALRVRSVTLSQGSTVNEAGFVLYCGSVAGGQIYGRLYGIDEDNTGSFGDPFSRSRTSAYTDFYIDTASTGDRIGIGAKDIVNEIIARGGWSSGNSMGFVLIGQALSDHGSQDNYVVDAFNGDDSYLWTRASPEPDFTPTPIVLASEDFPDEDDFGIKISKPGVDVLSATESQLYFTTRKRVMTVKSQGNIITTANPHSISHGLSYTPMVIAFALKDGKRHILPRVRYGAGDNIGWAEVTSTQVKFYVNTGTQIYYYIFYDQQP